MHITLIGAGPRGLVTMERIIEHFRLNKKQINISIVDPHGIGGRVWQVDQPHELIMNSNVNFITMFTDQSNQITGPIVPGPSLYEWSKGEAQVYIEDLNFENKETLLHEIAKIQANDYASRSLFGAYLKWFYQFELSKLPDNIHIELISQEAKNVIKDEQEYVVELKKGFFKSDAVIMSLGHIENELTDEESTLSNFAIKNNLTYLIPTHPQEYNFDDVKPGQNVILRGLGLSFFDSMTLLTQGRGGKFIRKNHELIYQPSGKEPKIIAGSRRGLPLHAKGKNQKATNENDQPHFFTQSWFANHSNPGSLTGPEFIKMIHKEIEYIYYKRLLPLKYPSIDLNKFLHEFVNSDDIQPLIEENKINPSDIWNWDTELGRKNSSISTIEYLLDDVHDATLGNTTGPFNSAFDMFHDIRDVMRKITNLQLMTDSDYYQYFLTQFKSENSFLSVGPPESRIEELVALINAGIVELLKPRMVLELDHDNLSFVTYSAQQPQHKYQSTYAVEARLPAVNVSKTTSTIIKNLINSNIVKTHTLKLKDNSIINSGAIDTISLTDRIDKNLYFWGVPTEGKRWFTTVSPRPNNNDTIFRQADAIVSEITSL